MQQADDTGAATARARPLGAVFLATFFVRFSFGITIAVFADYITGQTGTFSAQQFGTAGLVTSLAPVGEFTTVLLSGMAADRWGRTPVLFGGMAAAALVFLVVATTRSVVVLGTANFLFGIASGAILAASLAVVADRSDADERGLEMGRFDAVNLSGWVGGFAFGFGALGTLPNRSLGLVFLVGAVALAAGIAGAGYLFRGSARRGSASFSARTVLSRAFQPAVLVVTLPWLAIYALIGAALTFLAPATDTVGVPPLWVAAAIAGAGSLLVLTQPAYGRWSDRIGRTKVLTVGATGLVLVLLFASLTIAYGHPWPLLVVLVASVFPALAYGPAALAALADLASVLSRATTMAIYSLTISVGMFVGVVGASQLIARFGTPGLYPFFGAIAVVIVLFTAVRWRGFRRATTPAR